jgi:hypothetical protein
MMNIPLCEDIPRLVAMAKACMEWKDKPIKSPEKAVRNVFDYNHLPLANEEKVIAELRKTLVVKVKPPKITEDQTSVPPLAQRPNPQLLPEITEGFKRRKDLFD